MASNTMQGNFGPETSGWHDLASTVAVLRKILRPFASQKLAVATFALAILSVFFGTLGQVNKDIWEVVGHYFRFNPAELIGNGRLNLGALFAWIDFQIFFPPSFFPDHPVVPGGFWFPKGWLIGAIMAINLVAAGADAILAHSLRLIVGARGVRLWAGVALIVFGGWVTQLVINSGSASNGVLDSGWLGMFVSPSMRILWQLVNAEIAALVLLAGFALVFKKRAGIALLHSGVLLMMLSEFIVGTSHVETQMHIEEGQTVNFVQDIRVLELAVVDRADPQHDRVVVIPQAMFKPRIASGEAIRTVSDEQLPFDIQIVQYLQNSGLRRLQASDKNQATAGAGLEWIADELQPGVGTDSDAKVDMTAAYVKFSKRGTNQSLGTHLLSLAFATQGLPEQVEVDGKTYDVYLRFKRFYKPYSVKLLDVKKEDYPGTDKPQNYSSDIQLVDPTLDVDRKIHIWMNNPLRFSGETFYQSGYFFDPSSRTESTTLSVVKNTGWMIPYVSCMIVVTGMIVQFSLSWLRWVKRELAPRPPVIAGPQQALLEKTSGEQRSGFGPAGGDRPNLANAAFKELRRPEIVKDVEFVHGPFVFWVSLAAPLLAVLLAVVYIAKTSMVPESLEGQMNLYKFGKLPLLYEGRVKPFDTLARNSLMIISGKQTFVDEEGKRQPAIRWLLDLIADTDDAETHKVFRIENLEVLDLLGLEARSGFMYAIGELRNKAKEFHAEADKVGKKPAAELSAYEKKLRDLDRKVRLYTLIQASFRAHPFPPIPTKEEFARDPQAAQQRLLEIKDMLDRAPRMAQALSEMHPPQSVPTKRSELGWETLTLASVQDFIEHEIKREKADPATASLQLMLDSFARKDVGTFNREVERYQRLLETHTPKETDLTTTNREAFFNHFEPFYRASSLYIVSLFVSLMALIMAPLPARWLSRTSNWTAFALLAFTFLLHTWAIYERICISGRPPVTNLYSSAVFIGWGAVFLALGLELFTRLGIGNLVASVAGFAALLIAHFLSADGDTFVVLQAVLDTQFWLATHVVCITKGYATTYLAGLLGIVYIFANFGSMLFPPNRNTASQDKFDFRKDVLKVVDKMIYGVLCFATLCSFFGTVLGGLWADDSWGRFWGWDPKENGALIIVLWNLLILHARWDGMVKDAGTAVLAVLGNIVVSWSWFGVNELGVGLHSYGFTEGVLRGLLIFAATQLAIATFGTIIAGVQLAKSKAISS